MLLNITEAQAVDIPELVRLNGVVQDLHARLNPDTFRSDWTFSELKDFWIDRLDERDSTVAIARLDTDAVGCIWFQVQARPQNALHRFRKRIYVHHIVVDEHARRGGVGSLLLKHAEIEAERLGISNIVLDAWASNSIAQTFFGSHSYDPINIVLAKALEKP